MYVGMYDCTALTTASDGWQSLLHVIQVFLTPTTNDGQTNRRTNEPNGFGFALLTGLLVHMYIRTSTRSVQLTHVSTTGSFNQHFHIPPVLLISTVFKLIFLCYFEIFTFSFYFSSWSFLSFHSYHMDMYGMPCCSTIDNSVAFYLVFFFLLVLFLVAPVLSRSLSITYIGWSPVKNENNNKHIHR